VTWGFDGCRVLTVTYTLNRLIMLKNIKYADVDKESYVVAEITN
jgi:hypothetical protein